jgi:general stress protein 26
VPIWRQEFPVEIEYETLKEEVFQFLDKHNILFLATCADGRVTARAMSCVHVGLAIYFQTSRDSVKFTQISRNPNVALCAANIAIEGVATIGEHPLDSESEQFITLYQEHHYGSFNAYSRLESEVVIRVDPTLVAFWKYDDEGKPYREFLYVGERKAVRENVESCL